MTTDDVRAIQDIQGTAGFRVLENLIIKKITELDSVSDIDGRSETRAGIQALAKQKSVKLLKEFVNEINLSSSAPKETRRTFE